MAAGLVALGAIVGAAAYQRSLGTAAAVGRFAPSWALPDPEGRLRRLEEFRGRPVLINFWTTWCEPCREEIPILESFHQRFGDRLAVVGVNVREPAPTVRAFLQEFGVGYTVVLDPQGRVAERYRLRGFPESWLVDASGILRRFWPGPLTFQELERAYEEVTGRGG